MTQNQNISKYDKYKVLVKVSYPKSRSAISFIMSDPDKWFVDKVTYKIKSGEILDDSMITIKELDDFVDYL